MEIVVVVVKVVVVEIADVVVEPVVVEVVDVVVKSEFIDLYPYSAHNYQPTVYCLLCTPVLREVHCLQRL